MCWVAGERIGVLLPGQRSTVCYHEVCRYVDWAHPTLFTALVRDSKESAAAGLLEILEDHYCRKVSPPAILSPVSMDGRVRV